MSARDPWDFLEAPAPQLSDFQPFTIAWLIQRYIEDMDSAGARRAKREMGESKRCTLRRLQKEPLLGPLDGRTFVDDDLIEHCKERIKTVCPATINQEVGYLNVVFTYAGSAWKDCKKIISNTPISQAKAFLKEHGYIGKSTPRTRVPTDEEIATLLELARREPKVNRKNVIRAMPDIIAFALVSSRRQGEICSIMHGDIDWNHKDDQGREAPMYTVRNMKHPTKKDFKKTFPLFPELAEIIKRQPRLRPDDPTERVFPYNKKCVSQKYIKLKKDAGIENLHFHDNRREAITRWLKKFTPHQVRHFVSGHENTVILERNYDATDPADGHELARAAA